MRDVIDELLPWWAAGHTTGMGTVVETWKSAPRQPGAAMLVGPEGTAVGSVSGGCVEGAVFELASEVRDGAPPGPAALRRERRRRFRRRSDVWRHHRRVRRADQSRHLPDLDEIADDIRAGRPVAVATVVAGMDASAAIW
jgi:xanthine dehydrogenase accessory factor